MIVFEDEASFRQTPTLYRTWAPLNTQPQISTKGQRNTQKIFGAVGLYDGKFVYKHQEEYFNYITYIDFLENFVVPNYFKRNHRVFLIHDNASYHKKPETYDWLKANRKYVEVFLLPPYFPELNAAERIWQYTRKNATHNKYFETKQELCASLFSTFADIQENPENIIGLLQPFF